MIKAARLKRGMSQEDVARKIDVSLRHYQFIEWAKTYPTVPIALELCKVLGIDPFEVDEWKLRRNKQ